MRKSSFVSAYDALVRACFIERAIAIVAELSGVNRRPGNDLSTVDIAQAVAANAAKFAVTAGVCREHLDGLDRVSPKNIPAHIGTQSLALDAGFPLDCRALLSGDSGLLPLINHSRTTKV